MVEEKISFDKFSEKPLDEILGNFPSGPLDVYRRCASFDWKRLKIFLEGEERTKFQYWVWSTLANDPLFDRDLETKSLDETRRLTFQRLRRLFQYNFLEAEEVGHATKLSAFDLAILAYDKSLEIKFVLHKIFFYHTIQLTGTARHFHLLEKIEKNEIYGCFALTEISHGSNTKQMRTTATYDPKTRQFLLHSPDFESAKCWVGNLGQTATHALLYAQLYIPDREKGEGVCHQGLHGFVVPIRDPRTMRPYPGVIIGDMGEKIGWNGVDNGWLIFDNYRIPRENLLNRSGDVTVDGEYISPIKDREKRSTNFSNLGVLSSGRVGISVQCAFILKVVLPIAIRYSAARRQFGPENSDNEIAIIEYPMQRYRLFPYLAAAIVWLQFTQNFIQLFREYSFRIVGGEKGEEITELGKEFHALSSGTKPMSGWLAMGAIQECREACGGHGYLKSSRFGELRNDLDPCLTIEGDNYVLIQQTENYLLASLKEITNGKSVISPLGSMSFLKDFEQIRKRKFENSGPVDIVESFRWLVTYLLETSSREIDKQIKKGISEFDAKNNCRVFRSHTLAIAYVEMTVIEWFYEFLRKSETSHEILAVLRKLGDLYGLWCLEKHLTTFYIGGYCSGRTFGESVRNGIIRLCNDVKSEAVALADVLAVPDEILNSSLGKSDGMIYKNIFGSM